MAVTGAWWNAERTARWRVQLLSQAQTTVISDIDGVTGGVIDWNIADQIRSAGNLDLAITSVTKGIDWAKHRIKIEYLLTYQGRQIVTPVGVFIPSAPKRNMAATGSFIDLEFFDKTIILKQDALTKSKSFAAGSRMTDAMRWIITSTGERSIALTASTKKFAKNLTFTAGTTKLEMLEKVIKMANYFAIWTDGNGVFQCHPYVEPRRRPKVWAFQEGSASLHSAAWDLDQDGFEVPNRVVGIQRQPAKGKPLVAVIEDQNSRWGFKARGRWITRVEQDLDEKTQAKLNSRVAIILREAQGVHDKITIKHGFLPVAMNEIATFKSQGYSGTFAWRSMRANLTPTALAESVLEGVAA